MVHAVDSKAQTAALPPVMSKSIGKHPLCWLGFEEHCILTSDKDGECKALLKRAMGIYADESYDRSYQGVDQAQGRDGRNRAHAQREPGQEGEHVGVVIGCLRVFGAV